MEFKLYFAIAWKRKFIIVGLAALIAGVAAVYAFTATPTYEASATLRVLTPIGGSVDRPYYEIDYSDRLKNTYIEIATIDSVRAELADTLNLTVDELPNIRIEDVPTTELMEITVLDADPEIAHQAANNLANILVARSQELYSGDRASAADILFGQLEDMRTDLDTLQEEYDLLISNNTDDNENAENLNREITLKQASYYDLLEQYERSSTFEQLQQNSVSVAETAELPESPSEPNKRLFLAIGVLAGISLGTGAGLFIENLDPRIYTDQQVENVTHFPIIGTIPDRRSRRIPLVNRIRPLPNSTEAFRYLRTKLDHYQGKLCTILIVSAQGKSGRSMITRELGALTAQTGRRVLIVDSDLREPALHKHFKVENEVGLADLLHCKEGVSLENTIIPLEQTNLYLLPAGQVQEDTPDLLASQNMQDLLAQFEDHFDIVFIDSSPLAEVTDASVMSASVDGVLLVIQRNLSKRHAVKDAYNQLEAIHANVVGVVVNRA